MTAGTVGKKFKNAVGESSHLARPLTLKLQEAAKTFMEFADEWNELVHAHVYSEPDGRQQLICLGRDKTRTWSIAEIDDLAHRFENNSIALRDLMEGNLEHAAARLEKRCPMSYLATILITLLLSVPAMSAELFRYRGAAKDGGTPLEYVYEGGDQNSPNAITKEKVAEIAADFMTTFYHVQVGALETQEFRTKPAPLWLVSFSDTIKGALHQMYFVVLLPDGTVVVPRVEKRL
jgi:hypothetical protein